MGDNPNRVERASKLKSAIKVVEKQREELRAKIRAKKVWNLDQIEADGEAECDHYERIAKNCGKRGKACKSACRDHVRACRTNAVEADGKESASKERTYKKKDHQEWVFKETRGKECHASEKSCKANLI